MADEDRGHPSVERMREEERGRSGRSAYRVAYSTVYWLLIMGAAVLAVSLYALVSIFNDQEIVYLSRAPLEARIERYATKTNVGGHCTAQVWRFSEESQDRLRREGADLLISPHGFAPGWAPVEWRALAGDVGPEAPWNATRCPQDLRRDIVAWAEQSPSYLAVMRRDAEGEIAEAALFLIAVESGIFVRAEFSLLGAVALDPEA